MEGKITGTNYAVISGIATTDLLNDRTVYRKNHYVLNIKVKRLSGETDIIPVIIPEKLVTDVTDYKGQYICAVGHYHSKNRRDKQKRRLKLYVYASDLKVKADYDKGIDNNYIFLDGYLCKEPIYRKTPLGRTITDLLVAVNSPDGRSDYIPCICWGRTAHLAASLPVGFHVGIKGRIQSREYEKRISDKESEKRIAYEVSVSKLVIKNEGD